MRKAYKFLTWKTFFFIITRYDNTNTFVLNVLLFVIWFWFSIINSINISGLQIGWSADRRLGRRRKKKLIFTESTTLNIPPTIKSCVRELRNIEWNKMEWDRIYMPRKCWEIMLLWLRYQVKGHKSWLLSDCNLSILQWLCALTRLLELSKDWVLFKCLRNLSVHSSFLTFSALRIYG